MIIVLFHVFYLLGKHIYNIYHTKKLRALCDAAKEMELSKRSCEMLDEILDFEDEDSSESMNRAVEPLKFSPPAYVQRYNAVMNVLVDPKYEGKLRKIVDFGCSEMAFLIYLRNLTGVEEVLCVDIDKQTLERHQERAEPLTVEFLCRRKKPFAIEICEGSVTHNDRKLEKTDAVICIELIEHLYPDTLLDLPFNIFGYIMPQVVIVTTPNADFNVLFPNLSGYRHPDHKFEWTRQQFQDWAENIVVRYPCYSVTFHGIANGPKGTEELGACSQMAVFHRLSPIEEYNQTIGVDGLFNTLARYDYPVDIDTRSDEEKILDEAIYYINFMCFKDGEYTDEVSLSDLLLFMKKYTVTIETLKTILEDAGWTIENRENKLVVLNRNGSSDIDDDFLENDDILDEEIEWNYESSMNEVSTNANEEYLHVQNVYTNDWHEEPSIIIPENRSIVQENTYLFDGENSLLEQDLFEQEEPHVTPDDNIGYSRISDTANISLVPEQECLSNPFSVTLHETEMDSRTQIDFNKPSHFFMSSNNSPKLKSSSLDNITIEPAPSQHDKTYLRTTHSVTSMSNFQPHMSVLHSSTSPDPSFFNFESNNYSAAYQNESHNNQHLLNSTFYQAEIANEAAISIEESIIKNISGLEQDTSAKNQVCENSDMADMMLLNAYSSHNQPKFSSSPKTCTKMTSINIPDQNYPKYKGSKPTMDSNISSIIEAVETIVSDTESSLLDSNQRTNSNNTITVTSCTISSSSDVKNTSEYNAKCSTSDNTEQESFSSVDSISAQLMQGINEEFAERNSVIDHKSDAPDAIQNVDAHHILSLGNESINHKEENVFCTLATTLTKTNEINTNAHIEKTTSDLAQSDVKKKSINPPRELLSSKSQNDGKCSSICAKETNVLEDDSFVSCKSNENTNSVQVTSVLKDEENVGTSKDISNIVGLANNIEVKPTSPFETPPNSWSPEIMDSGYPNSVSAQDITPEYDLSSIAQDHIPDSESPSVAEAPRLGVLEPIEVENGDLANNNRDDEGNNMMAVDANIEDLQPLIDVLENDLENENDIYVMQNGFPIWLLRILDMANPLDLDMQARQNLRIPDEVADDANYMGHDEGFDSSSSESDVVYHEVENDNKLEE